MESTEVWPGIDSALHELGMLCSDESKRGSMKDKHEKNRMQLNDFMSSTSQIRCQDRYLLPSQAWNRPGILSEVGGSGASNGSMRNNHKHPDGENTENSYAVKGVKVVKISEPKSEISFGNDDPNSICRSDGIRENEGLNVLRMNSQYITGVAIATVGASGVTFNKSESYVKPMNTHSTPKHGVSVPSLRHHHLRPYDIPWRREERVRTKSETTEKEGAIKLMDGIDMLFDYHTIDNRGKTHYEKNMGNLLKSRSLENVRIAEDEMLHVPVQELDSVSNRIQHLHVND